MKPFMRAIAALLFAIPCLAQSRDSTIAKGAAQIKSANDSVALIVMPGIAKYCAGQGNQNVIGFMKEPCATYARYLIQARSGDSIVMQGLSMPHAGGIHDTLTVTKTLHDTVSVTRTVHDTVTVTKAAIPDTIVKSVTLHDTVTLTKTLTVHDTVIKIVTVHDTLGAVKTDTVKTNVPPPPPPPPPGHPNEPTGMAQLSPLLDGTIAPPSTWTSLGWVGAGITTATDTVPGYGQTSVLNINYPPGSGNGTAPGRAWTQYSAILQDWQTPVRTLYLSYWYKLSPNFPASLNANKMVYEQINHANSGALHFEATADQGTQYTAPLHPRLPLQNIKSANGNTTISQDFVDWNSTIPRGQWFFVEGIFVANSAGTADGSARMFVNGKLVITIPNIAWDVSGAAGLWDTLLWDPVYNLAVPADAVGAYHRLKDLYVSGKP